MQDWRSQLTLSAVAAILGLLIVVQLRGQGGGSEFQSKSAQELTGIVVAQNSENDRLRAEVTNLTNQLAELRADRSSGATSVGQLESDLGRIRAWTGLDPIAGRGVAITIDGEISASAVDDLLNELRNAGAEAIAIEEIRVVARTSVGGVPGSLDVDGFLLRDPFTLMTLPASKRDLVPDHGRPRL
jgi:uncharacterized protein YlxW (UPF0749 family)